MIQRRVPASLNKPVFPRKANVPPHKKRPRIVIREEFAALYLGQRKNIEDDDLEVLGFQIPTDDFAYKSEIISAINRIGHDRQLCNDVVEELLKLSIPSDEIEPALYLLVDQVIEKMRKVMSGSSITDPAFVIDRFVRRYSELNNIDLFETLVKVMNHLLNWTRPDFNHMKRTYEANHEYLLRRGYQPGDSGDVSSAKTAIAPVIAYFIILSFNVQHFLYYAFPLIESILNKPTTLDQILIVEGFYRHCAAIAHELEHRRFAGIVETTQDSFFKGIKEAVGNNANGPIKRIADMIKEFQDTKLWKQPELFS